MSKVRVEKKIGDGILSFETGWMAKQAAACVLCQYQDTIVLNAVTTGPARPGTDFFPLTCDYRERTSAAGKFPGGFIKREGRPTTKETLTSRLIDRPIRPMFADGFLDEVQCQALVLSSDRQNDADVLAMNGVAAALLISSMPFEQAVASVRVGRIDGQFIPFPTHDQLEESDLDLIVSGTDKSVTMIEGFAREMPEDEMMAAIDYSHSVIREVLTLMQELKSRVNPAPCTFKSPPRDAMIDDLRKHFQDQLRTAKMVPGKQDRADAVRAVKELALNTFSANVADGQSFDTGRFQHAWHDLEQAVVRELILNGTRSDGRDSKTLRPIDCHVGILPRVHGSALFQRGETQALITITLGTNRDEQRVDGLQEEYSKKFMLDYNFPAFSVGECKPNRGPGRREIGHGMLAERSLKPVLPDPDDFPYTVRVISDILESNGSSSMATVCGTTLGLMDAGVKIKNPVAGISIGLVIDGDRWTLLTDIIGDEDHFGDMDFKIAGTPNGITGIQLDLKIRGISSEIIRATMTQSRETRLEILKYMLSAIDQPREEISLHAPRLLTTQIDPEKIGMLIGPGGKNIRAIQEETDTVIEVDDSGKVTIASSDSVMAQKALARVELSTATVQIGKIYDGVVSSIKDFGAFVEILPGRDGLCHISELSSGYVGNVHDVCQVGDEMKVFVIDIDGNDRIKLSRRRALEELGLADEFADPVEEEIVYEDEEIEDDEFVEDDEEFVEGEEVVFVDDEDEFVEDEEGVALEDRPRDDRPREERPREDRPREERPRSDRSRDDRPRSNDRGRTSDRGPSRSGGRPAGDRGGSDRGGSDRGGYRDSRGGGNRSGGGSDRGSSDRGGSDRGGSDRGGSDRGGSDRGGSDRGGYRDQRSGSSDRGNFRDDRGGGDRGNSGRGGQGGGQGGGYRGGSSRGGSGGSGGGGGGGGGGGRGRGGNDRNRGGGRGRYDR